MSIRRAILDTNLYIEWLNRGHHEDLILGPGLARYLSAVVILELQAGATTVAAQRAVAGLVRAYDAGRRVMVPTQEMFERAGRLLPLMRKGGLDVRRASFINDLFIALSARASGATLYTLDRDFERIREFATFELVRLRA